jgi:hypothetical protein
MCVEGGMEWNDKEGWNGWDGMGKGCVWREGWSGMIRRDGMDRDVMGWDGEGMCVEGGMGRVEEILCWGEQKRDGEG